MDDSQIHIPDSFIHLFVKRHQPLPRQRAAEIAQRFEVCDDMAAALLPRAQELQFKLGLTEADVIDKLLESLTPLTQGPDAMLGEAEARWVVCHLAEQLGWLEHLGPELRALAPQRP
jgi:hypothetical protein